MSDPAEVTKAIARLTPEQFRAFAVELIALLTPGLEHKRRLRRIKEDWRHWRTKEDA